MACTSKCQRVDGISWTDWVLSQVHPALRMISKPLKDLLCKGAVFQWTPATKHAFKLLRSALTHAPVLALPNFSDTFVLETDACNMGIGAVLMQQGNPVAYLSKSVCPKNQDLSTYEKE